MKYGIKDLDPVSIRKDDRINENFAITLITEPFCKKCNSQTPIFQFCRTCKITLEEEIKRWEKIHKIIAFHKTNFKLQLNFKSASKMHFIHSNKNDYYEILGKNESFRKQSFRWPSKEESDFSKLFDDKDTESDGGSDGDAEFNNELFSQHIGQTIHEHNDKMSKSSHDLASLVK